MEPGSATGARARLVQATPWAFVLLWSSGFIGAKLGLPYAEPLTFLSIRFVWVIALLLPLALWLGRLRTGGPLRPGWATHGHAAVAGILLHGGYLGGVFSAIHHGMNAGAIALLVSLQPVITAIVAGRLLGERVHARQWLGLVLGLAGVALVLSNRASAGEAGVAGLLLGVLALASITGGTLYQKRFCAGMDLWRGSLVQFAAALAVLGPLALLLEDGAVQWTGPFVFALGWLVVVLSIGAISLLHLMIRAGEATRVAAWFYLTPPTTALMAWLMFDEPLTAAMLVGVAVTATGVALVVRRPR